MSDSAGGHAIGAPAPAPGTWVVVHERVPAAGAPDPRDEAVLALARALASLGGDVVVLAVEPVRGSRPPASGVLAPGVSVRVVSLGWAALVASWPDLAGVVATGVGLADALRRAGVGCPVVLAADTLPSLARASVAYPGALDAAEGAATGVEAERTVEARVLSWVALTVSADRAVVAAASAVAPGTPAALLSRGVHRATTLLDGRRGVAVVGRFVAEPGLPDELAARAVVPAVVAAAARVPTPVSIVALDGAVSRRAWPEGVVPVGADQARLALGRARAAVVLSASDDDLAWVHSLGLPAVAASDPDLDGWLGRVLASDVSWHEQLAWASARLAVEHDPAEHDRALHDALRAAGLLPPSAPAAAAGARTGPVAAWRAPSRAGTLAALTTARERFVREAAGPSVLARIPSLVANAGRRPDERHRLATSVRHEPFVDTGVVDARVARLRVRPRFSVVMPVFDTEPELLDAAVASVLSQRYPGVELCIADDASPSCATRAALDRARRAGAVVIERREQGGIAAATNDAIAAATGEWVAFCDHDDVLRPDALYWVARLLELEPALDVVYSDEDKLDAGGRLVEPFAKPGWSPDLLLSLNYVTHLTAVRRSLLDEVGGLRAGFDGAQDYDLLLRLTERTDRVGHVPRPLYAWRKIAGSTAADIGAKPAAHDAGARALREAIERRGLDAEVAAGPQPTWHRVRYRTRPDVRVSVLVPTRDRVDLLAPCLERLEASVRHDATEVIVVDNESTDPATLDYLDTIDRRVARFDTRVVRYPHAFNFARQINLAARAATGEVLLLLNNDVRPAREGWFEALLEHALRPEVGAVGALLRWPDGRVQHAGIVANVGGVAYNLDPGPHAVWRDVVRDVLAVTGACLMLRTNAFWSVGGMDERLRVAYNDVDLCLRLGEAGYRCVYTPYALLEHPESSSRGSLHPDADEAFYQRRWGPPGTAHDPFAAVGLDLMEPYSPRL